MSSEHAHSSTKHQIVHFVVGVLKCGMLYITGSGPCKLSQGIACMSFQISSQLYLMGYACLDFDQFSETPKEATAYYREEHSKIRCHQYQTFAVGSIHKEETDGHVPTGG